MDKRMGTNCYASASGRNIRLMLWTQGQVDGLSTSVCFTEKEARQVIRELEEVIAKLPRVATAADFGMEELA